MGDDLGWYMGQKEETAESPGDKPGQMVRHGEDWKRAT